VGAEEFDESDCEDVAAGARCGKASWKDASLGSAGGVDGAGAGSERMGIEVGVGCCGSALLDAGVHSQPILSACNAVEPVF
jgi:hypothetical protein